MLQSYACSFVPITQPALHNQGYAAKFQIPSKWKQNCKCKHSLKNSFSERKTIIRSMLENRSSDPKKEHIVGKIQREILKQWDIFYRFTHPYVVMGTIIGATSVSLLPLESAADLSLPLLVGVLKAVVLAVLLTIYSCTVNNLFDIEIDKVNKPFRSSVTGEMSIKAGIVIVATTLVSGLAMGIMLQSPPLLYGLLVPTVLTSAYTIPLPLLRWKNNPFLSAIAILIARGFFHVAFFIHIQKYVLGRPFLLPRSLVFAVAILSLFSIGIALLKDIPDVDGDREHGVQTFSIVAGKEKVFWLGISLILMGYGSAMVVGASCSSFINRLVTVSGHAILASSLWHRARSVDLGRSASFVSLYLFIWKFISHNLKKFKDIRENYTMPSTFLFISYVESIYCFGHLNRTLI